jgi:hypothetical protein
MRQLFGIFADRKGFKTSKDKAIALTKIKK